ncbi:TonB-dependent receptor domain-containing protein [Dyella sp.]|uniref:TonB-dependent receptor domain-containing protein n=1 Tax=Dyella sp. TaxID=1869338 RepID=UPI002B491C89|nr:TonB-dependent receptor [Dyella sp.]HKT28267.1 TonB-dependent receptor [Dyella sp.]
MKTRNTFNYSLLALACATALASTNVFSQDSDGSKTKTLEGVTVTGSHIAISNPNVISPTPVAVVTAEEIHATGATNIGDLMATMPQLATTFTMGNSTQSIGTAGVQQLDLRNLGPERTLVLVNGRRFVGSSAGSSAVDVNLIPTEWVERVEIITGGASAVYGADAVTGVVNFILKKNYQGVNLHAQYGVSQHGGFSPKEASITGGMNFAHDRGNIAISVEHSEQDPLMFPDRFGNQSYRSILTPNGPYESQLFSNAGGYGYTNGGTFSLDTPTDISKRYVLNPDGSVRPQRFDGPLDSTGCSDCDRLDVNKVQQLQPEYKRTSLSSVASFNITPDQRLYAEGSYSHVDVKMATQPAFGTYTIYRDNAFISPSLAALMDANGLSQLNINRFDVDARLRGEATSRDTGRVVFGANGVIAGDWEYDASVNYGVMNELRQNLNNRINDRFAASTDAVRDSNGNIVCRSSIDPSAAAALDPIARNGCIPTSLFGEGAVNPEAAQWFNTTTLTRTHITQFVGGGTVTNNNLFQMPFEAGAASIAIGTEFRRESSRINQDPLDVAGLTFLNAIPSSGGAYNVKEGYIETLLPLLADRPFAKALTLDAAIRFSDYSTIGHTKAWRWGLDWAIDDNIRLRGTMSSAVRAPNIDELYSGQSQNFFSVNDPCSAPQLRTAPNPAVRAANCQALGVPQGWKSANGATIAGISGSNPNLGPETGKTWTAGFVFTPQFLTGFGLTMDYWNIRLNNAISAPSGTQVVNQCVDNPNGIGNVYCAGALRDPNTHEIVFINSVNQNISALSTSGMDIGAYYSHDIGPGKLRVNLNGTRVFLYTEHPFQDDPSITIQDNGTLGYPKWKITVGTNYAINNWTFNWRARYFSPMLRVSNESYASDPIQINPIWAGNGFFNDLSVSYKVKNAEGKNTGLEIYGGINNIADRNPPVNLFGTGFGSALYDAIGRSYYAGFNYKF